MSDSTKPPESERQGENRQEQRRREPVFNLPGVVTALIGLCIGVHLVRAFLLTRQEDLLVIVRFAFWPLRYTGGLPLDLYAFVSPFTYAFLHGGVAHLAVNMIWLAAFGSPLANRLGPLRFLGLWAATAFAAVFLHFLLHPYDAVPLVGASGAVSGMMGAAARFAFRIDRSADRPGFHGPVLPLWAVLRSRMTMVFLTVWFVVNLVVGLASGSAGTPEIAWQAHIGGFLVGFFGIGLFDPPRSA
ncbi:rhomboid family intramembrane serine protease [Chelativorans intermedius]|uniref:Rhomboid family intramembrane serine protease n=1 Tax=Chelativorans intermedius TaxID=515947 RepID=A0ABV6D6V0_9HYPH|nr:rhomboid family intramembrane serine protease [Chelativorans intermedius]MCT8999579.1 rhomboid family intramembrane serine protease [Chelativorans intermedius]